MGQTGRQARRQADWTVGEERGRETGERGRGETDRRVKQAGRRETIERQRMSFMVLLFSCAVSASDSAEPPADDACAVPPTSDAGVGNSTHTPDSAAAAPAVGDTPPAAEMASSSPVSTSSILNPQLMDADSVRQAILGPLQEEQAGGVTDPDSTARARPKKKKKKKKRPKSAQTSSSSESAQISQPTTSQSEGGSEVTLTESLDAMSLAAADTSVAQSAPKAQMKKKKKKKKADSGSEVAGQDVQVMDCGTEVAGPGKVEGGGETPQVPPEIVRVQEALFKREKVSAQHHQHHHNQHSPHGQRVLSDTQSGKKKPHQKKNVVSASFEKDSFCDSSTVGP